MRNLIKNKILLAIIALVLIIIGCILWYFVSISHVNKNDTEIEVTIPLGSGTSKIAEILKENKLIRNTRAGAAAAGCPAPPAAPAS